jgi:hypothetical protein
MVRCISVYTNDFGVFSDIYEEIMRTPLNENEEQELEGVVFSDSGEIDEEYMKRLKDKPEVVVMRIKDTDITILQHGDVFEIFMPTESLVTQ